MLTVVLLVVAVPSAEPSEIVSSPLPMLVPAAEMRRFSFASWVTSSEY